MITFPETMKKLDTENAKQSIGTMESYIRYMCDRVDFAIRNVTKSVSAAGVSNAEIYVLVTAIGNDVSSIKSTITNIQNSISELDRRVTALEQAQPTQQTEGE